MELRSLYITAKDEPEAQNLGQVLVNEKLVACINYFPIQSIYRWQGNIEHDAEVAIIAKTRAELVDRIIERVKQIHSYEVPCIVSWIIEKGNPDYFNWIIESTGPDEIR